MDNVTIRCVGLSRWFFPLLLIAASGAVAQDISVSMVAMTASNEGRDKVFIDRGLDAVKDAIASLTKFDTFRFVNAAKSATALEREASIAITPKYTLYCTPHSRDDAGRILTSIRIEMAPKDAESKPINVVKLSIHAVPGDKINILGPKIDDAHLVVVLTIGAR